MDMKGITWVGNIFKKFEAMCLEVEEVMYQDTVEYVENQVQTVGSSVKKFCSDVVQDLLPPPSVEPVKGIVSDLPVDLYDVGIYIKPPSMKRKKLKLDDLESSTDSKLASENNSEYSSASNAHFADNHLPLSQVGSTGGISRQYVKGSTRGTIGIRKRKNLPRLDSSGAIGSSDSYTKQATTVCELPNENYETSFKHRCRTANVGSVESATNEYKDGDSSELVSCTPTIETSGDVVNLVESERREGMGCRLAPSDVAAIINESSWSADFSTGAFDEEEHVLFDHGRHDEHSSDVNDSNSSNDDELEIVEQVDQPKPDETCVIVDGDEFQFAPNIGGKSESRKKIRDVLFLKKKSIRRHEYKQLAKAHVEDLKSGKENCTEPSSTNPCTESKRSSSSLQDVSESEWELL